MNEINFGLLTDPFYISICVDDITVTWGLRALAKEANLIRDLLNSVIVPHKAEIESCALNVMRTCYINEIKKNAL